MFYPLQDSSTRVNEVFTFFSRFCKILDFYRILKDSAKDSSKHSESWLIQCYDAHLITCKLKIFIKCILNKVTKRS